jgi:hypothetical protein
MWLRLLSSGRRLGHSLLFLATGTVVLEALGHRFERREVAVDGGPIIGRGTTKAELAVYLTRVLHSGQRSDGRERADDLIWKQIAEDILGVYNKHSDTR